MNDLTIIAGPCSVDDHNFSEIIDIAKITIDGKPAVAGTRVVGLKSRTSLNMQGSGMGIDYEAYQHNLDLYMQNRNSSKFLTPPSIAIMREITKQTNMLIATEIMNPLVQLPSFEKELSAQLMLWNPSVNQLGWQTYETALFAKRNNWQIGIKNAKWVGNHPHDAQAETAAEKTWAGLASYASHATHNVILIHRGFDVPEKGTFRNMPIHQIAAQTKVKTGAKLYFDPSHSFGPKHKDDIPALTLEVLKMRLGDSFLYDGLLIEAGTSITDTDQHITVSALKNLLTEAAKFRKLVPPSTQNEY